MDPTQDSHYRTLKAKKSPATQAPSLANPGHSGPTTFFLRSEKEMEKSTLRGRRASRDSNTMQEEGKQKTPMGSMMSDSGFGVQSLEDTISSTLPSLSDLSRTTSNTSETSAEPGAEVNILAGRKRKAGNPVHPKIVATGQRILSSEHATSQVPRNGSPISLRSTDSPVRPHQRRRSVSSSINFSQPITPLRMSPRPDSAMPSTPRSGSPKSFRLSDEEVSVASDTNSQAVHSSSSGEEEESDAGVQDSAPPQLVMPSIAMPARRPFTQEGRHLGRLKIMVVGARGVGKTSLIQSMCRACDDIVHLDPIPDQSILLEGDASRKGTIKISEIGASTRPFPAWWTDFESRRMLLRRKSIGDGVLERNITFVDTPGFHNGDHVDEVLRHFKSSLARTASMEKMNDSELVSMLSGEGGVQVDAVVYLFHPSVSSTESPLHLQMDYKQSQLLRYLCKWTNVIPVIGRADGADPEQLTARKQQLTSMFGDLQAQTYGSRNPERSSDEATIEADPAEPFAVSSALGDDTETIDASILMSSGYLQPLAPSELDAFVHQLFDPENAARLRHMSAIKFLLWRQEDLGAHMDMQKQLLLQSPRHEPHSPDMANTDSITDDPCKVLVPHASSSYFRSTSPSTSDSSSDPVRTTSAYARAPRNATASPTEPFRQVRLAKWAQDLQRSLDNERRRYKQMYASPPSDWMTSNSNTATDSEKVLTSDPNLSLISPYNQQRPPKGRLGGDLAIIDPSDPLGILSLSRRGWFALQIAGGCGLIGAVAWWVLRNWSEVQEMFGGFGYPFGYLQGIGGGGMAQVTAVPAPSRSAFGAFDENPFIWAKDQFFKALGR